MGRNTSLSARALKQHYETSIGPYKHAVRSPLGSPARGAFLHNYPHELSFVAMQRTERQDSADELGGFIETIVQYDAKDSAVFDIQQKVFHLYGASDIGYEDMKLAAEHLALDWSTSMLTATGKYNEAGAIERKPIFIQGTVPYIAEELRYNFDAKRGTARKLFTKQEEALIQCDKAKMDTEDTYYADCIRYTTCNLVKPHYYIKARKVKFVRDQKVATGPFQFYFDDVPTPLGFFYGLFFVPKPKTSGIILPKPGEDRGGFFLREGGYYFYFNDYIDLALRGSLYSKGSSSFKINSNYKQRYSYTGGASYERTITTMPDEKALQASKDKGWRFQWQHNTVNNKISSLAAEVDFQSQSFNRAIPRHEGLNATTNSRIRYTNSLVGLPYTLSTSLAHSQNFQTNVMSLILPEVILSTGHIYPFRRKSSVAGQWYKDIYCKHSVEFKTQLTNVIGQDTLKISRQHWPKIFRKGKYGAKHTIPVETNIKIFKYFNLKPCFEYRERWYFKSLNYKYDDARDTISIVDTTGFKRVWDYSLGASLQTTLYGIHFFGPDAAIQAIRHQLEPAVGFTYTPDFSKEKYAYWQKVQTQRGEKLMNRFDNFIYGAPENRASAVMDFKVGNTLAIKVCNTADPAGHAKEVPILEALNLSTSYDFEADSFKLSDIKLEARTRILDSLINVEYNPTFDPYIYKPCVPAHNQGKLKRRVEEFAWHHGQGLGHIKKSSLKISTSLKPPSNNEQDPVGLPKDEQIPKPFPIDSTQYVDFDVPWGLNLAYHRNYTYQIESGEQDTSNQLSFDGELGLTKKWKITFGSAYDLDKKALVGNATTVGIYRDLHCWQMKFDWRPLGKSQSYEFSIGLKAPILQDIKYPRSNEYDKL